MGRKKFTETRIAVLLSELFTAESMFTDGDNEKKQSIAIIYMKLCLGLSIKERRQLAELEAIFWQKIENFEQRTKGAKEATRAYYNSSPQKDSRTDYEKKQGVPALSDIPSIVAYSIDGGQQATEGRELKRRLEELRNSDTKSWLSIDKWKTGELEEFRTWLESLIEDK